MPGSISQHQHVLVILYLTPILYNFYSQTTDRCSLYIHAVSVSVNADVSIRGAQLGAKYNLDQIHFHWGQYNIRGSEHRVDNFQYAAEVKPQPLSSSRSYSS